MSHGDDVDGIAANFKHGTVRRLRADAVQQLPRRILQRIEIVLTRKLCRSGLSRSDAMASSNPSNQREACSVLRRSDHQRAQAANCSLAFDVTTTW